MTTNEAKDRSVSEHSHSLRQRDTIHLQDKATSIGEKGSANVGSICPLICKWFKVFMILAVCLMVLIIMLFAIGLMVYGTMWFEIVGRLLT